MTSKTVVTTERVFDHMNANYASGPDSRPINELFLRSIRNYASDRLQHTGFVFLNEVYALFGFPPTRQGASLGWVRISNADSVDVEIEYLSFNDFKVVFHTDGDISHHLPNDTILESDKS